MERGVPAGAYSANHPDASNPGIVSATVGISSAALDLDLLVTASARNFPAFTKGKEDGIPSNMIGTCPPITSVKAGPLPLYGIC